MPLVEAAASAGHRKAMEGNGWSGMVRSPGSRQFAHETLKIPALNQSDSGAADKSATYLRGNIRSDPGPIGRATRPFRPSIRHYGSRKSRRRSWVRTGGLGPAFRNHRNSGPQLGGADAGEELRAVPLAPPRRSTQKP